MLPSTLPGCIAAHLNPLWPVLGEFERSMHWGFVIGKTSVHSKLLVPLRRVAILETNKLKSLVFSFMRDR